MHYFIILCTIVQRSDIIFDSSARSFVSDISLFNIKLLISLDNIDRKVESKSRHGNFYGFYILMKFDFVACCKSCVGRKTKSFKRALLKFLCIVLRLKDLLLLKEACACDFSVMCDISYWLNRHVFFVESFYYASSNFLGYGSCSWWCFDYLSRLEA